MIMTTVVISGVDDGIMGGNGGEGEVQRSVD